MEKFHFEKVSIERKDDVIEYMQEHQACGSNINGDGGFDEVLEGKTYEECLNRSLLMEDEEYAKSKNRCPAVTYLLIRENDNRLIGMINIRHILNETMLRFGGHIGYGVRPSERRKGYNKINLYLGLIKAYNELGLDKVMLDCDVNNLGSDKTIKALGGVLERCELDPSDSTLTNVYWIDTLDSIEKYKSVYEKYIDSSKNMIKKR